MADKKQTSNHSSPDKLMTPEGSCSKKGVLSAPQAHLLFWPVVTAGLILDLWTKTAVLDWLATLPNHEYILIEGYVKFIPAFNDGAAFSLFAGKTSVLVSISLIAMIAVLGIFIFGKIRHRLMVVILGMFTAGIVGNLYDRMFNDGHVRDFIDVIIPVIDYHWPTFNVADSLLCIAVGLMFIANFTSPASQKPAHPQK